MNAGTILGTSPRWGEVGSKSRVRGVERNPDRKGLAPLAPTLSSQVRGNFPSVLFLALAVLVCALGAVAALPVRADPQFPALTGRVVDNANLLSDAEERELATSLEALEAKSTDQVVVVTLPSLQGYEIEEFGYRLGRHWGIGQKDKDNGVLLIVAPNERKVRIEVGRGLEPILTDALTRLIIENAILPQFRRGDFPAGIRAGAQDIVKVLTGDAEELKTRARSYSRQSEFDRWVGLIIFAIWLIIFIAVLWSVIQSIRHGNSATRSGKRRNDSGWTWGGGSSSGGGWSSGGGGFSGGGGGFGGGGSSGGW